MAIRSIWASEWDSGQWIDNGLIEHQRLDTDIGELLKSINHGQRGFTYEKNSIGGFW